MLASSPYNAAKIVRVLAHGSLFISARTSPACIERQDVMGHQERAVRGRIKM
jgi:hypothetical protein